jgi:diguanylate cyclase (GGDEF)-like protein/PAS domain S-box-containing protein
MSDQTAAPGPRAAPEVVFNLLVALAVSLGLVLASLRSPHRLLDPALLFWVVLIAVVELLPVRSPGGIELTVSFPLMLATALLYPPAIAGAVVFLASFDIREVTRRVPFDRAWFNRSQMAAAVAAGSAMFHATAALGAPAWRLWVAVAVAAWIIYGLNAVLVAVSFAYSDGLSLVRALRIMHGGSPAERLVSYIALGMLGGILAQLQAHGGLWPVVLLCCSAVFARQMYVKSAALSEQTAELERLLDTVQGNEERFRGLVQNASDLILVMQPDSTVTYQTPSAEQLLGVEPDALHGTRLLELVHPEDRARVALLLEQTAARAGVSAPLEWRLRHRDGTWIHVEAVASNLLALPRIGGIVCTIRSIMERRAYTEQLQYQAFHDPVTALANRLLFSDRLGHALERRRVAGTEIAVILLDLDDFKLVNDSLGHEAGDRLLVTVAERLRSCTRSMDTAARLGGDEFAILLEDVDGSDAAVEVVRRVIELLRHPVVLDGKEILVQASLGVALAAGAGTTEELLRNADLAMYAAKANGKGCFELYQPSLYTATHSRLQLTGDLQQAIEGGQFTLAHQPVVALDSGRVVGFEALLRWAHPERGSVPPMDFIRPAEESGLIVPIGQWVLDQACRQAARWWRRLGEQAPSISVNLSARQLQQPDFGERVRWALADAGLPPELLILELTESLLMQNTDATSAKLRELKHLGVGLAIDDFGTGYSSLSYLRQFPVDMIKIDKSFVDGMGERVDDGELVGAIVKLGHTLRLVTVAEGVETADQVERLRRFGCERGQGYLFGRPLDAAAADALLDGRHATAARSLAAAGGPGSAAQGRG